MPRKPILNEPQPFITPYPGLTLLPTWVAMGEQPLCFNLVSVLLFTPKQSISWCKRRSEYYCFRAEQQIFLARPSKKREEKKSTRHTENTLLQYWLWEKYHSKNPTGVRATTERLAWARAFCQFKRPLAPCSRPIKVRIHVCLSTVLDFDDVPVNYTMINTSLCFSRRWYWRITDDWREPGDKESEK